MQYERFSFKTDYYGRGHTGFAKRASSVENGITGKLGHYIAKGHKCNKFRLLCECLAYVIKKATFSECGIVIFGVL